MAKYLAMVNYTAEGMKGILKEGGTGRKVAIERLFQSLGGTVESIYYALGETDLFIIIDLPDNITAAAAALTVGASGTVTTKVIALLTPEDVDAATKKSPLYRPGGQ
jgi:uncharacterized protein with GYD domain